MDLWVIWCELYALLCLTRFLQSERRRFSKVSELRYCPSLHYYLTIICVLFIFFQPLFFLMKMHNALSLFMLPHHWKALKSRTGGNAPSNLVSALFVSLFCSLNIYFHCGSVSGLWVSLSVSLCLVWWLVWRHWSSAPDSDLFEQRFPVTPPCYSNMRWVVIFNLSKNNH